VGDFKGRHFTGEVILWAVRWYLMFPVSYRDLELMLADRGVEVDHTTIFRWIQAYAAELEKRLRPHVRLWQWLMAGRRDLYQGQGPLDVFFIERSTAGARRSIPCSAPSGIRLRRSGSSARRSVSCIR